MHTGFSGRFALIEALTVDDAISALISARVPANEIKRAAVRDGMKTLRMVGLEKAFEGLTTIGEILRVTPED
jgi:type II secretory ATPase GspE/PulE/Tfp pilus assembly ATPase PilB-like protein